MGFLAGVVGEINRQEDAQARADEFMMGLLEKRKNQILPALQERIANRTAKVAERESRVDQAVGLNFSRRSAEALELTGQLEFQLEYIKSLGRDLDPTYIGNLTAGLEERIDNDEDLAAAVAAGLSGPLDTEEDRSQAFIRAYQATDAASFDKELANLISYTGGSMASYDTPFKITAGKGDEVSPSDANNIKRQVTDALSVMFDEYFTTNSEGRTVLKQEVPGGAEVNFLFNQMIEKATEMAQDPFNTLSTVGATQLIVDKIQPALGLNASVVSENLDTALTDDTFNWDTFR